MFISLRVLGFNNGQKAGFPCRERGCEQTSTFRGLPSLTNIPVVVSSCVVQIFVFLDQLKGADVRSAAFHTTWSQTKLKLGLKALWHFFWAWRGDVAKPFGAQGVLQVPRTRENWSMHSWEIMSVNRARETEWQKTILYGIVEGKLSPFCCSSSLAWLWRIAHLAGTGLVHARGQQSNWISLGIGFSLTLSLL